VPDLALPCRALDRPRRPSISALLVVVLLLIVAAPLETSASGTDLTARIAAVRRSQVAYESAMRAADADVRAAKQERKAARREVKETTRNLRSAKHARAMARGRVAAAKAHLREVEADVAAREQASPESLGPHATSRLRKAEAEVRQAKQAHRQAKAQVRRITAARAARKRHVRSLGSVVRAAVSRRESAEGGLGASIVAMIGLAQERASRQTDVHLTRDGEAFAWPAWGRITQPYGCTGFPANPPRGDCRHFHDGLDIAPDGGSRVRAAAPGVVAWVGWNPWDGGDRAFMVIIGHTDGFETRYGHLQPRHPVRVGEVVAKGRVIGRMGDTGRAFGVHLHMELWRGSTTLDPQDFLPQRDRRDRDRDRDRDPDPVPDPEPPADAPGSELPACPEDGAGTALAAQAWTAAPTSLFMASDATRGDPCVPTPGGAPPDPAALASR
jgi:murein DD-endopeptidase MepM/ murein hydrolase activator NlpD